MQSKEDAWSAEEAAQSSDPALAKFYALLNDCDRWWLREQMHIDIHQDRRRQRPEWPPPTWVPFREIP